MDKKQHKIGLHYFRHDLRMCDNDALFDLMEQCEAVVAVYIFDPSTLKQNRFGHYQLGRHRHTFLDQGLLALKQQLSQHNVELHMFEGKAIELMQTLVQSWDIDCISYNEHYGYNEAQDITLMQQALAQCAWIKGLSHYLLKHYELPFPVSEMPDVFSPFRRRVEKDLRIRSSLTKEFADVKEPLHLVPLNKALVHYVPTKVDSDNGYVGGESEARKRVNEYFFESDGIASYKETRNGLDGWDFSSRLSAYLAMGFISPAYVFTKLTEYENTRTKNDSTYWLFFELLWREFFHLQAKKQGVLFFRFGGIQQKPPSSHHNDTKFTQWKQGQTPYPIVNAAMKQLATTGFMSNRARQLVASCFVHELNLDWRYGAAYFEEMLIDYDVASNYGNWQYLAGVGSDPRGHRQFNLDKQTQIYDPNGEFVQKWA